MLALAPVGNHVGCQTGGKPQVLFSHATLFQGCLLYTSLWLLKPDGGIFRMNRLVGFKVGDMGKQGVDPVSYTHLDVYKRQPLCNPFFQLGLFLLRLIQHEIEVGFADSPGNHVLIEPQLSLIHI